jgi:hypothetical protein
MENITINGEEYKVKYSIRALFIYEKITGETFSIKTTMDEYLFFYSILLANNQNMVLTFEQFLDACDDDMTIS